MDSANHSAARNRHGWNDPRWIEKKRSGEAFEAPRRVELHPRARGETRPRPSTPCPLAKASLPRKRSRAPVLRSARPWRACVRGRTGTPPPPPRRLARSRTPSSRTRRDESARAWTRARSRTAWLSRGTACSSCCERRVFARRRGRKTSLDGVATPPFAKPRSCWRFPPGWTSWWRFSRARRARWWRCPRARPTRPPRLRVSRRSARRFSTSPPRAARASR